jgi:hypothetical protein
VADMAPCIGWPHLADTSDGDGLRDGACGPMDGSEEIESCPPRDAAGSCGLTWPKPHRRNDDQG